MKQRYLIGHIFAIVTVFIWGTTFISTKLLLQDFSAIEVLFIRSFICIITLMAIYPKRLKITDRKQEFYFAFAGLSGITLYHLLENIALTYTLASNVGVIIPIAPFFTAILARFFVKNEKLRTQFFIGFVVAISGIILISFNGSQNLHLNPLGDILAVAAAILWAFYSILTKKISTFGYNPIQSTRRIFCYGLLFMLPAMAFMGFDIQLSNLIKPTNLFNILYLGFGASALCFVMWSVSVKILGAVKLSAYIYLIPVITVVTSVLVLGEKVTLYSTIGVILTLTGLVISEFTFNKKKEKGQV